MKLEPKHTIATCAVFVGLFLVAAGFLWPLAGEPKWPQEKAEEFAKSSAALHEAAHGHQHGESAEEFAAVQRRFEKIKAELETARQRPEEISYWLKVSGGSLAAIGLVMLVTGQHPK
ncbi:hypothetical protein [Bythopirellula goksoeyrii]|uniref:Uncharacterized protein n=1 Tax=Bythopirellula goksoeyrii TaxID=1400387 RepID=A0A5B9QGW0_9BACT|nr:hypothetical protein [Bythopirellula goksoeyrii]QEG33541.1 hypothetical protein Pr1d_08050 [Bythopirellula goksoeyrii]